MNTAQVKLRLTDDSIVVPDSITCKLTKGGHALKPLAGGCAWKLSKKTKKAKLVLTITASYQGNSSRFVFNVRVR